MRLGTVSFTLGGAEPIAFAVYSDDDKSLDFYKRLDVPEIGDTFEGKTVTEVHTGIETDTYASRAEVPWANHKADIVKIEVVDRIRPVSMAYWFDMANVENPKITEANLSEVDTGACKSMRCLFANAKSLKRIDGLRSWDTSSCTTMRAMFGKCSALKTIDVSNWNTSKASDLSYMFQECSALQSLDVSRWDTSSCTTMTAMFGKCSALKTIDVSNWNTSSCTAMSAMFCDCLSLESLDISRWDTSKVTTFQFMFAADVANKYMKLRAVGDLSNWNTSNVTNMSAMFQDCEYLENIGDISGWDTSKVANMSWLFNHCVRLNDIGNLSRWDTSSCTNMYMMFSDCLSLESLDLSGWNTSKVTTFTAMFATSGNQYMKLRTVGDLSDWNTSNATDMSAMFQDCEYLENIGDISGWDTSKVANMSWLFNRCVRLNGIGDLSRWDTSNCNGFSSMFRGEGMTKTGMEIDVSFVKTWDVRSATDISGMFRYCTAQEEIDLSGWDISSVKDMSSLFDGMTGLKKISLPASWKWIGSTGTAGYLPAPSSSNILGADGKWYSTTTGKGYAPTDILTGKVDTYVASKELLPKVAFAVYSADDGSLNFYKRPLGETPAVGDAFNGTAVTDVYTGFETAVYQKTSGTSFAIDDAVYNTPWFERRNDIKVVKVVDSGIKPTSIANWFARFESVESIDLTMLDASNVRSMRCTFSWCKSMKSVKLNDTFDTVLDLTDSFYCSRVLECLDLSCLRSGMGRCFWGTFAGCMSLKTLALPLQTVIGDMSYCFADCAKLNYDCSDWNVDNANTEIAGISVSFSQGITRPKAWQ